MIPISSDPAALRQLMRKESLTGAEAERLFSGIDRRLFLEHLISLLRYRHFLTDDEILKVFSPAAPVQEIPLSILADGSLSALEAICRYLREKGYRYSEIARLLNRDQRTIWVTCSNSMKKRKEPLSINLPLKEPGSLVSESGPMPKSSSISESGYTFPLTIFQDRNLSVLEAVVHHLKSTYHLRYSEIARLIRRDERNIWGIWSKAEKKLGAQSS